MASAAALRVEFSAALSMLPPSQSSSGPRGGGVGVAGCDGGDHLDELVV
jgi:hypothetical protein